MRTNAAWAGIAGLCHGFLDREECVAGAPWTDAIARVGLDLPVHAPKQVHGTTVVTIDREAPGSAADAIIASGPGALAGIVTADCVPILLMTRAKPVVAAVHAGWRGASAGVVEATLARLASEYGVAATDVSAAIGPAIGPCCYPIGRDVLDAFAARTGEVTRPAWDVRDSSRLRIDLRHAVTLLLEHAGVRDVHVVGPCTACDPSCCSFRRDGERAGRQLSVIGWRAA